MDLKSKTCCFTGHRDVPKEDIPLIRKALFEKIVELREKGIVYYGAGGALGFDTIAAQTVIDVRDQFPEVKLILVLPCREQANKWSHRDKMMYNDIIQRADKTMYVSEHYHPGCMHERNRHLVDESSYCICYLTRSSGGTKYTVDYAAKHGLEIFNIAEAISGA